jgi:CheY-like chemotaxis protein
VLVVGDQHDAADMIVASLRAFYTRARMESAANGFEGLLKVGTFRPDVLLLDLSMPVVVFVAQGGGAVLEAAPSGTNLPSCGGGVGGLEGRRGAHEQP